MNKENYKARAKVIKALAHPSRLEIMDMLSQGERCVCELQEQVGADITTISKHLSLMKKAGIVTCRKAGQQVFYRLRVPCILRFFDCIEAVIREEEKTGTAGTA